ncbi:hypothetical protein MMC22_002711 [Lobaria immixta]|nr:hypothetical protein [Lobaria immixta]
MDVVNIAASIINSVCDFIILLLPQGVIWKLQMPIRRKLGISAIFLIGLLACIASIMRLYYSIRVLQTGDDTYYLVIFGLWTHAEFTLAIICGSLPVSPRFFQTFQPKILRLSRSCFQMRAIPQKIIFGLFTVNRGKESSSTCRGNGPYELHGEYSTTEVYGLNSTKESGTVVSAGGKTPRSLASSAGGPVAGLDSGEGRPDKNQILKTVNIETIEEAPNGSDTDVERQHSQSGW